MDELELRREIIATALEMNAARLNRGKSGNVRTQTLRAFSSSEMGTILDKVVGLDSSKGGGELSRMSSAAHRE